MRAMNDLVRPTTPEKMENEMTLITKNLQWVVEQAQAVTLVDRECLAEENLLMISKWPAYRFMTPLAATKHFAVEYAKAYKVSLRTNVDITAARNSKAGEDIDFVSPNGQATRMWNARQEADRLGAPYPEFLEFCFDFATRRQRRQLPQPNQLMGGLGEARATWHDHFAKFWVSDRISNAINGMPFLAQYQIPDGRLLPAREAFQLQLLDALADGYHFGSFVGNFIVCKGYLDKEEISGNFPPGTIERKIEQEIASGFSSRESGLADTVDLYQSCHGLPGLEVANEDLCSRCPALKSCAELRRVAESSVFRRTGSIDPRREHELAQNRKDVRNFRARKKAETAGISV